MSIPVQNNGGAGLQLLHHPLPVHAWTSAYSFQIAELVDIEPYLTSSPSDWLSTTDAQLGHPGILYFPGRLL